MSDTFLSTYSETFLTASFDSLNLHPKLVQTVADLGYTQPTPIQAALIPVMLTGQDAIGQAQTGTGKTAAFALPLLNALEPGQRHVQALVLVPTRELATQVAAAMFNYGKDIGASVLAVYGGQPYPRQIGRLKKGVDIVVGTPGRLIDLMERGALDLTGISTVVLDEADEMLSMGFADELETILQGTPESRQTVLLSATLPQSIRRLADRYLRNPQACRVERDEKTAAAIEHRYIVVHERDKVAALARLLEVENVESALVFARTRVATAEIADNLAARGYRAEALNGEMSQPARTEVLDRFRSRRTAVLVATDVAARGLDIDHVSHVFNLDLPRDPEVYVHRIGRTGRAGRTGVAVALVAPSQRGLLRRIESYTKHTITQVALPTPEAVEAHRDTRLADELGAQLDVAPTDRDRRLVLNLLQAGHDPLDLAAAALSLVRAAGPQAPVESIGEVRETASHRTAARPQRHDRGAQAHEEGMVCVRLSAGHADGVHPGAVVSAIARHADIPGNALGRIRIEPRHTFVDVPEQFASQVLGQQRPYKLGRTRAMAERA